jgi:molybdopterin converting factor small subunit
MNLELGEYVGKIKLKIMPWITTECGFTDSGNLIIEEEISSSETVGSVIKKIQLGDHSLAQCLLDPITGNIRNDIVIIINEHLIPQYNIKDAHLENGDTILFLPPIEGG